MFKVNSHEYLLLFFILVITLFSSCDVSEQSKLEISASNILTITGNLGREYTAEIYLPNNPTGDVLYYFPGVNGNASSWRDSYTSLGLKEEEELTVISVSFGPVWFLTDGGNEEEPIIQEVRFVNELMPDLESYINTPVQKRILWGFSMGAYNGALLSLKNPNLFDKVVLNSPSILTVSPYETDNVYYSYIEEMERKYLSTKARLKKLFTGNSNLRNSLLQKRISQKERFPTANIWEDNDIINLSRELNSAYSSIYISCGTMDEHSFFEGSSILANNLSNKDCNIIFEPIKKGDHNAKNYQSIKQFLLQ